MSPKPTQLLRLTERSFNIMVDSTHTLTTREPQLVYTLHSLLTKFIAIAGKDFCLVAADTRMSLGYSILSREYSKTTKLTDKIVITSGGMVADIEALHKNL
jgi:20S proteasome alpha/beta subunit